MEEFGPKICTLCIWRVISRRSCIRRNLWKSLDEKPTSLIFRESFPKKLHMEESVVKFGQTNCTLCIWRFTFQRICTRKNLWKNLEERSALFAFGDVLKLALQHQTGESQLRGPQPGEDTEGES